MDTQAALPWNERIIRFYADLSRACSPTALLRFAPLTEPPPVGFSWLRTALDPETASTQGPRVEAAHESLRQRFIAGLDGTDVRRAVDVGCGNGADVAWLADRFPAVRVDGCNVSPEEIEIGRAHVQSLGLAHRARFHECDLARDPLPDRYDFALALQVIHHVRDKQAAFLNLGAHLREGGWLVLAESVANTEAEFETAEATSTLIPRERWAKLMADNGLRLVEVLDASAAVSCYLDDPSFEENLAEYGADFDPVTVAHLRLFDRVGRLLRAGAISYLVMRARKDSDADADSLLTANRAAFAAAQPLAGSHGTGLRDLAAPDVEPIGDVATWLRTQIAKALECDPDRIEDGAALVELGIDSLVAHELKNLVRRRLAVEVPILEFLNGATFGSVVNRVRAGGSSAPQYSIDSELRLLDSLSQRKVAEEGPPPRAWLLTGGAGFLGVHLINSLLEKTDANVLALIRAPDVEAARRKLESSLRRFGQFDRYRPHSARVRVIAGDLSLPQLGQDQEGWDELTHTADGILHAAAATNFLDAYEVLRPTNVLGTITLLQLAQCDGQARPFHYVSSGHVLYDPADAGRRHRERDPAEANQALRTGYQRSKWIAERLVAGARQKGIPVAIYRPAWIEGHSRTGVFNPRDFLCNMLRACAVVKAAPVLDMAVNFTPVDYTADAIAALARQGCAAAPHAWHIVDPEPAMSWNDHIDALERVSCRIDRLPYADWRKRLAGPEGQAAGLGPWLDVLDDFAHAARSGASFGLPWLEARETHAALARFGVAWSSPDRDLLDRYVNAFLREGFFPGGSQ